MTKGDWVKVRDGTAERYARLEAIDGDMVGVWLDGEIRWFNRVNVWLMQKTDGVTNAAFHKPDDGEDCR